MGKHMQNGFCVILSKYRLYQGIALYHSLDNNYRNFKMFILCADDETYEVCKGLHLANVILLKADVLNDERLISAKETRKLNEYCWTLKPFFIEYVLKKYDFVDHAVYIDADIYFFNDPSPIFESQSDDCILLSEHDYLKKNSLIEQRCGKYNSGFIIFKRCETSLNVLRWWAERCIEWCGSSVESERFGDQKYLEQLPFLFKGVSSITTPSVNIAPWNEKRYKLYTMNQKVFVNNNKLICYHFSGMRLINKDSFALLMGNRNTIVYSTYIMAIQHSISQIEQVSLELNGFFEESHLQGKSQVYKFDNQLEERINGRIQKNQSYSWSIY